MPKQQVKKRSELGAPDTPHLSKRDPSLLTVPTTSTVTGLKLKDPYEDSEDENLSKWQSFKRYLYDRKKGTFCNRTCKSWGQIIIYSIFYLIFLMTYTMIFLYGSLVIIKQGHSSVDKLEALRYTEHHIGLSVTPTSINEVPIIWYREGHKKDYEKYITGLDEFLSKHKMLRGAREDLGPCGRAPYGYWEKPCVIVRINKLYTSNLIPMKPDSPNFAKAPKEVQEWVKSDNKKLWLFCKGFDPYDTEHIRGLKYHPYPPGYDSSVFPLGKDDFAPLVGVQIMNFTKGISVAINCQLYFENGLASTDFLLYIGPKNRINILKQALKLNVVNVSHVGTQ